MCSDRPASALLFYLFCLYGGKKISCCEWLPVLEVEHDQAMTGLLPMLVARLGHVREARISGGGVKDNTQSVESVHRSVTALACECGTK